MTLPESHSLISFFCCDTVAVLATVCTVFLLLLTYYLKSQYSDDLPGQISRSPEEPGVFRKTASPERNVSGDVPRRTSGRRRRREESTASPSTRPQQMPPACTSEVHSMTTAIVTSIETDSKAKCRSSSTEVHKQSMVPKPVVDIEQSVHSSLSKSDEVLHSTKKSSNRSPKQPVPRKPTTESSPMTLTAIPLNSPVPVSPKQSTTSAQTVTADSAGEWRDVTPRRKERRRSRHSSKQSESGTPVSSVKQNSPPPSEIPVPVCAAVDPVSESQALITVQPQELSTPVPKQDSSELSTSSKLEEETGPDSRLLSPEAHTLSNVPDEPDPATSQGKSSKSKTKRKRRGALAPKTDVIVQEPVLPHPPSSLSLSTESTVDHQRATPDDSEFEMVDISSHHTVISSATESDPDNSLSTDWSLAQPIPQTGDIHEFPCLPGTESQFAIVHPSGLDSHLECGQHPLARCLLSSALNDPVEEDSTADRRDSKLPSEVTIPANTVHIPTTKTTVKRSKARKAD